jgi:acyl-coenzyme A thioesterase PaaI-like protein
MKKILIKETLKVWAWGATKVPMIFALRPRIYQLDDKGVEIMIPLSNHAKNHLRSMYFGALSVGADCAGGLLAVHLIEKSGKDVALVFKDFKAQFLKRPEGDTHFRCDDGAGIKALVEKALSTPERVEMPVHVTATVPKKLGDQPVAQFTLTLSLKRRDSAAK